MKQTAAASGTRVIIVTGLSGSGKTTVLHTLEDLGFYCVDNLPVALLPSFLHLPRGFSRDVFRCALVMDSRQTGFVERYPAVFKRLDGEGYHLEILFLECSDTTLVRRFSETRRQHPLAQGGSVSDGIRRERAMLAPLREAARWVLDSSVLSVHQLRDSVVDLIASKSREMAVILMSFGYKHGLPLEADMVIDIRFLPNPYFVDDLRPLDGRDQKVRDFVLTNPETGDFLDRLVEFLDFLLPRYHREGKAYLTIAVGCTGGRHRSVALVEDLAQRLADKPYPLSIRHRDADLN
jgi:UPF0042 nucleotide-binding protein